MKKLIALALCAALTAGIFSGCSQEEKTAHIPTGDGLYTGEEVVVTTPKETEPVQTKQIVMAYYAELGMNPYTCVDYTNRAVFPLIYQSLFVTDREGVTSPLLCKSFRVSADMKNYTFYIMDDARFADGDPVTGEDVTASLLAAMSSGYFAGRFSHVKSIANTRDGGVLIQMDTAFENLPLLLDIPIVKKEQVNSDMPIGSGPYVLRAMGTDTALYRNANWWCNVELPIEQQIIPLSPAANTVDIRDQFEFFDVSLVLADPCSAFYAEYRCDYELRDCESGVFVYLGCNTEEGVFAKEEIRKELTYAIDRNRLAEEFYNGFALPTVLPTSPKSPYYDTILASRYAYQDSRFAQAVVQNGEKDSMVTLLVNSDDTLRVRAARSIAEMLNACGLVVTVKEETSADYYQALRMKEFDLYMGQTRLSPNMDLTEFFYEDGKLSFGPMNEASIYTYCLLALENSGNYTNLYERILNDGRMCPLLFRNYAVYASRGMLEDLEPARDNLFYYDLGRNLNDALEDVEPEVPAEADTTVAEETIPEETTAPEEE